MPPYRFPLKFGKYLLTRRIAVGGMAEVFKTKIVGIKGFEKTLALKKILPEFNEDEEFVQMFVDEARISSHLYHSNIVQVFDFGVAENSYYISMEYIDGPNLKNFVQRLLKQKGLIPRNIALYIVMQIARGLEYAHNVKLEGQEVLNLVHRDISPQNILLSRSGEVKITDFGIAKAAIKLSRTQPGKIQGKFSYMSPEQATGKSLDRRSDLFSLGIIAYELLSGIKVYAQEDTQKRYREVREAKIERLGEATTDLPGQVESLVMRMLEKDAKDRPQSAAEIVTEVSEVLTNISTEDLANQLGQLVDEYFPREASDTDALQKVPSFDAQARTEIGTEATPIDVVPPDSQDQTKSIPEEPTIPAYTWFPSRSGLVALFISLAAIGATVFYFTRGPSKQNDVAATPSATATEIPVELAPGVTPNDLPPRGGPIDSDIRSAARARETEAEARLKELETELARSQKKAQETSQKLAQAEAALKDVKDLPPTAPCPSDMVFIKSGEFLYGSDRTDPDRNDLVEPEAHMIPLPKYCIDRYEYPNKKGVLPLIDVTWTRAQTLCSTKGKRLCAQEEWERACKGPGDEKKNRRYPYGNRYDAGACNTGREGLDDGQGKSLKSAGSAERCQSPEGLFDMSGNADEWTAGRGRFNPESRVTRGGSKNRAGWSSRCVSLRELADGSSELDIGFRCCKDAM